MLSDEVLSAGCVLWASESTKERAEMTIVRAALSMERESVGRSAIIWPTVSLTASTISATRGGRFVGVFGVEDAESVLCPRGVAQEIISIARTLTRAGMWALRLFTMRSGSRAGLPKTAAKVQLLGRLAKNIQFYLGFSRFFHTPKRSNHSLMRSSPSSPKRSSERKTCSGVRTRSR